MEKIKERVREKMTGLQVEVNQEGNTVITYPPTDENQEEVVQLTLVGMSEKAFEEIWRAKREKNIRSRADVVAALKEFL